MQACDEDGGISGPARATLDCAFELPRAVGNPFYEQVSWLLDAGEVLVPVCGRRVRPVMRREDWPSFAGSGEVLPPAADRLLRRHRFGARHYLAGIDSLGLRLCKGSSQDLVNLHRSRCAPSEDGRRAGASGAQGRAHGGYRGVEVLATTPAGAAGGDMAEFQQTVQYAGVYLAEAADRNGWKVHSRRWKCSATR